MALEDSRNIWSILSPITITFLPLKVSGVSQFEKTTANRRPEYENFINSRSAFIPWFPKRVESQGLKSE
jgi:steroid 5-alpha reductase family enzyme